MVGRISFFVNAGLRFITEICKMRAFAELWDEITRERYGITDPKQRLFRYGVQVNSLGLTEQQPENNVTRILIEMLAVTLSKNARARAVQLPAWNEALGLPRPWDQQWSLRMQQILAYETDLLEYGDIFDGSDGDRRARSRSSSARRSEELKRIDEMGGAVAAVESGYMKQQLVESNTARLEAIERGEQIVVGVNKYLESEPSPLTGGVESILTVSEDAERGQIERLKAWRAARDDKRGRSRARRSSSAPPPAAPTSCRPRSPAPKPASPPANGAGRCARPSANTARRPASAAPCATTSTALDDIRADVDRVSRKLGRRLTFLVGKPGLDGHSNGAEQIAVRARDAGMQVVYEGIRLTPEEIVDAAREGKGARHRPVGALRQPPAAGRGRGRRA